MRPPRLRLDHPWRVRHAHPMHGDSAEVPRPGWLLDAERVDRAIYAAIAATDTPSLDRGMTRLTRAADHSKLSLAAAAVLSVTRGCKGRRAACEGLASVAVTSAVANLVLKPLGRRRRPDRAADDVPLARHVPMPSTTSFPSGHSASAFAFATGVGHVLPRDALALRTVAALVAYSRVHTGVHYPSDVVSGAVIGVVTSRIVVQQFTRRARLRPASAPPEPASHAPGPARMATFPDVGGRA